MRTAKQNRKRSAHSRKRYWTAEEIDQVERQAEELFRLFGTAEALRTELYRPKP